MNGSPGHGQWNLLEMPSDRAPRATNVPDVPRGLHARVPLAESEAQEEAKAAADPLAAGWLRGTGRIRPGVATPFHDLGAVPTTRGDDHE